MKKLLDWFVDNPVAANMLMILVVVGGGMTLTSIRQEMFPTITPPLITVSVPYPGAAPETVEDTVTIKIEEAVHDIDGVKQVNSTSAENLGSVTIEMESDADGQLILDEVKTRVDAIVNFPPPDAEKPVIQKVEMKPHTVNVAVFGNLEEAPLKRIAERVRDEL